MRNVKCIPEFTKAPDSMRFVQAFKFHGVYCHSTATIPFSFINLSTTRVCAEIDLTKYSDFSLTFPGGAINSKLDIDFLNKIQTEKNKAKLQCLIKKLLSDSNIFASLKVG